MAQRMVEYSPDFLFHDGIYLSFSDFKANNPVPITHIITDADIRLPEFMDMVTSAATVRYYGKAGDERVAVTESVWGYAFNGRPFIRYGDGFVRIPVLGAIAHFTAAVTTYRMVSSPMMMGRGMMMNDMYEMPVQEIRQYLLDMATGTVTPYSPDNARLLFGADPSLAAEFDGLKKRKRQETAFLFIRRYNDRHPLYFPE